MKSETITFAASAARTGTVALVSPIFDLGGYNAITIALLASAKTGTTPTLDCLFEDSVDGVTWYTHTAFTQLVDNGSAIKRLSAFSRYGRITTTIGGTATPGYTYSVLAHLKEGN